MSLSQEAKDIRRRLVTQIYEKGGCHYGSCLSCVEIVQAIYELMLPGDKFIMSKSHATPLLDVMGRKDGYVHEMDCYGGNLGNGAGVGLGLALCCPSSTVYVLVGDGEAEEGSFWEALNYIKKNKVQNIKIVVDCNGFGAYSGNPVADLRINVYDIKKIIKQRAGFFTIQTVKGKGISFMENKLESHYMRLTPEQYNKAIEELSDA